MRGFLWVKTLSTCGTSDGGAIGVATFLEASLVETHLGQFMEDSPVAWHGCTVQSGKLKGGCRAQAVATEIMLVAGVVAWMLVLAACSRLRRLALLGNCRIVVELRQKTALAATTLWDDLACSGLRRVA